MLIEKFLSDIYMFAYLCNLLFIIRSSKLEEKLGNEIKIRVDAPATQYLNFNDFIAINLGFAL